MFVITNVYIAFLKQRVVRQNNCIHCDVTTWQFVFNLILKLFKLDLITPKNIPISMSTLKSGERIYMHMRMFIKINDL